MGSSIEAYLLRSDYARAKREGAPSPDEIRKRAGRLRAKRLAAMRDDAGDEQVDPGANAGRGPHGGPKYVWCGACRAHVIAPCVACQARATRREKGLCEG